MTSNFITEGTFQLSHPTALAVYCSDGRFTGAVEELLRSLGHPRLDTLTIPGGPGLLNYRTSGYGDCDTFSRAAEFLIREHTISAVVLLAHVGCGYYTRKLPDLSADQIRKRQIEDLQLAMHELSDEHPRLTLEAYLAVVAGDHVRFDPISRRE